MINDKLLKHVSVTLVIQSDKLSGKGGEKFWSQSDLASLQGNSQILFLFRF